MAAPNLTHSVSGKKVSGVSGKDFITVTFSSNEAYAAFECRATKAGEEYGVGVGELVAAFSTTPAGTERSFEIYDDHLVNGDGAYRISLFAQSEDGSWNDNQVTFSSDSAMMFANGQLFLAGR